MSQLEEKVLLALSGWRPGMLLTSDSAQDAATWTCPPRISIVKRLKKILWYLPSSAAPQRPVNNSIENNSKRLLSTYFVPCLAPTLSEY